MSCSMSGHARTLNTHLCFVLQEGVDQVNVRMLVEHILSEASPHRLRYAHVPEAHDALFDMSKESISAVMAMLEKRGLVHVCNTTPATVTIAFLTNQMESLQQICRVVASILKLGTRNNGQWTFSPCEVANDSGEDVQAIYRQLRMYKTKKILRVDYSKERAMACLVTRSAATACVHGEASLISSKLLALERRKVGRIEILWGILTCKATDSWREAAKRSSVNKSRGIAGREGWMGQALSGDKKNENDRGGDASMQAGGQVGEESQEETLGDMLVGYFSRDTEGALGSEDDDDDDASDGDVGGAHEALQAPPVDRFLRADIIAFCNSVDTENKILTGRAVARIFHGIQSPAFTSRVWYHNAMWQR